MTALFLDIDGVVNRHQAHPNGYSGCDIKCVEVLNRVLDEVPECHVVVSSAWRYLHHSGSMTLTGLEHLLLTHGLNVFRRIVGVTAKDELSIADHRELTREEWEAHGLIWRRNQIREWVTANDVQRFAVLDDLSLDLPELVRIDPATGLTDDRVAEIVARLRGEM